MPSTVALLCLSAITAVLAAPFHDFDSNIAYKSPSKRVAELEIPLASVHRRLAKRAPSFWTGNVTFPYSVASGDPESDSIVLWTKPRKYDIEGLYGSTDEPPVCLKWQVSSNANFSKSSIVASGKVTTTWDVDYSVKVIASGLKPYHKYSYQFSSCAGAELGTSPVGTFKTLPDQDSDVDKIKLAFYSCSNYPFGFFNAYGNAANHSDEIDYVQHIGDYIYEYAPGDYGDGTSINRVHDPRRECSTLEDYRIRYSQYRSDPDLLNLHQRVAWQTVWDDHEVADQAFKAGTADSNNTGQGQIHGVQFTQRKANAVRAYFEWMPIRQVDTDDKLRIWRSFKVGKLMDMIFLDTRQYDRDITDLYYNTDYVASISNDTDRSIMGSKEEGWFYKQLSQSQARNATWRLVMQQVVFSRLDFSPLGEVADFDAWDGYRANRKRILEHVEQGKIDNFVVLSGDSHASWVNDIVTDNKTGYDPVTGKGALGVEFAGSAVSSPSSYGSAKNSSYYVDIANGLTKTNSELKYAEGQLRGYVELTVTPSDVTAEYIGFVDQESRSSPTTMATFEVKSGANRLTRPFNQGKTPEFGALGQGANHTGS